jgi:bifunctional DNA-binding transcriptional regulator/antitoxin component of YhaV-PrlF toxin-antitoxin module
MWDETLLAYSDRSRVIPEAYRKRVIVKAGDVLPSFTVDGYVAGLWWAEVHDGEPRVVLEPFEDIPARARRGLEAEADRLVAFIRDREPAVYERYRNTRRRD